MWKQVIDSVLPLNLPVAVPVIAVFTKYDQLISRADRKLNSANHAKLNEEQILELVKKDADSTLQQHCIDPFKELMGDEVPFMTVSSKFNFIVVNGLPLKHACRLN
jgi:hypothetical protein